MPLATLAAHHKKKKKKPPVALFKRHPLAFSELRANELGVKRKPLNAICEANLTQLHASFFILYYIYFFHKAIRNF